jgi:hypothetical protein
MDEENNRLHQWVLSTPSIPYLFSILQRTPLWINRTLIRKPIPKISFLRLQFLHIFHHILYKHWLNNIFLLSSLIILLRFTCITVAIVRHILIFGIRIFLHNLFNVNIFKLFFDFLFNFGV